MKSYLSAPIEIGIELTENCNLNCKHCYQVNHKIISLNPKKLDFLIEDLKKMKVFNIFLGGGEPLLYPSFFEVAKKVVDTGNLLLIGSNGTLIDKKIANEIANISGDFDIQISLEGPNTKINDKIRGKGSFKKTVRGIKNLIVEGVNPTLGLTINKYNFNDLENFVKFTKNLNLDKIHFMRLMPFGKNFNLYNSLKLTEYQTLRVLKRINCLKYKYEDICFDISNIGFEPPSKNFNEKDYSKLDKIFSGCPAGKTRATVTASGDVIPCDIIRNKKFVAGNINKKRFYEIWNDPKSFSEFRNRKKENIIGKCRRCKYLFACVGGCPMLSIAQGKDINFGGVECPRKF